MVEAGKNGESEEHVDDARSPEVSADFLGTFIHELRNPLGPLRNAAEVLRTVCAETRQLQLVDIISRQVGTLTRTLDDVTAALQSRKAPLLIGKQTVDVSDIVEPALHAIRSTVDARHQGLLVSLPNEPVQMHCDPVRLTQVVQTLLDNATRHTPEGGSIALKVGMTADHLLIEVLDDGAGIPADRLGVLFNMFATTGPTAPGARSGLNLAVARSIVEMHGGTIEAFSDGVGRGSKFIVRLPIATAPTAETAQTTAPSIPSGARRVLIIEDHEDSASSLRDFLAAAGHAVVVSNSGEFGIAVARSFKPEAVIIDIGLPGMDGFDVAKQLREHEATASALLIALSGYSLKQFRDLSAYSMFRHYLLKPSSPETILAIIEGSLNTRRVAPRP